MIEKIKKAVRLNPSRGYTGHKHSEETKERIRQKKLGQPAWNKGKPNPWAVGNQYAKGQIPWNKGKPLSDETKEKLSKSLKGRKVWNKGKKCPQFAKEKNPAWRGGVTPEHEILRKSLIYREWLIAVFERDDYTCVLCNERGGRLNADHIKPFSTHPELRLDIDNGRTLCVPCHRKTDTWGHKAIKELK